MLPQASVVAKYEGHLVSTDGTIFKRCTRTDILFSYRPELKNAPFSREHCASVMVMVVLLLLHCFILVANDFILKRYIQGKASNLKIDGTHHQADVDHLTNRGGVPWGALLNSSEGEGVDSFTYHIYYITIQDKENRSAIAKWCTFDPLTSKKIRTTTATTTRIFW